MWNNFDNENPWGKSWGSGDQWGPRTRPRPEQPESEKQETPKTPQAMLLYVCPVCGYWVDKALWDTIEEIGRGIKRSVILAFGGTPPEDGELVALTCPNDHGEMKPVQASDRLFIASDRVAVVPIVDHHRYQQKQELLTEYFALLKTGYELWEKSVLMDADLPAFWWARVERLQKKAEALGITTKQKAEGE